jgi:hypothetical protein
LRLENGGPSKIIERVKKISSVSGTNCLFSEMIQIMDTGILEKVKIRADWLIDKEDWSS